MGCDDACPGVGWTLRRGSEQNESKKKKKSEREKRTVEAKSSQTTSGYTNSVRVACSAKTDQERAAWNRLLLLLRGEVCAGPER